MEFRYENFQTFLGFFELCAYIACRTSLTYVLYDAYANIASHAYQILGTNTIIERLFFYIALVSLVIETLLLL